MAQGGSKATKLSLYGREGQPARLSGMSEGAQVRTPRPRRRHQAGGGVHAIKPKKAPATEPTGGSSLLGSLRRDPRTSERGLDPPALSILPRVIVNRSLSR